MWHALKHPITQFGFKTVNKLQVVDSSERPIRIYCNNKAIELYSKNNRISSKSKYIDLKYLVVKDEVQSLQVFIEHIDTNFNIANPLTKGLPATVFYEH